MTRTNRLLLAGLAAGSLLAASPAAAQAWRDPASYPARVTAIQFTGARLDSSRSIHWKVWRMQFGPGLPRASYNASNGAVLIDGLVCWADAPRFPESPCRLTVSTTTFTCFIFVQGGGADQVDCPNDIALQR